MRCPTCADMPHPGFIAWREVQGRDGVYWRDLRPCPDCGGSRLGVPVRAGGDIRGKMSIVFVAPGAVGVVGGLAAVGIAKRFPSNESALKLWGARIAILGLALAGLFLPFI